MLVIRHDVHIYNEPTPGQQQQLDRIEAVVNQLVTQGVAMSKEFDDLQAQVERNTEVDNSVVTLVNGLAAQIEALKNDPRKLQAFADQLRANNDNLASAVAANTPADTGTGDSTGDTGDGTTDTGGTTGDGTGTPS
jgi:phage host-nuclease inhibitor protein Gam